MARRRRNRRQPGQAPGWLWMLFGLTLGLAAAAIIYLSGVVPEPRTESSPARTAESSAPASARAGSATPATKTSSGKQAEAGASGAPSASSGKRERAADETQFDFYEILPQYEVVVPEVETVTKSSPAAPATPVETPGDYVLQAGSFRSHEEADRMQASLALLGIESRIQKVTIDSDEFHRVRIGPISDLDTLNRVRGQLRGAGINPLVMRVKD